MPRTSAGLLPFARDERGWRVWLGHMGGPMWARRPRAWTIVKGEVEPDEDLLAAAEREFAEETGAPAPAGPRLPLGQVRQSGGKVVHAWAIEMAVERNPKNPDFSGLHLVLGRPLNQKGQCLQVQRMGGC